MKEETRKALKLFFKSLLITAAAIIVLFTGFISAKYFFTLF